MTTPPSDPLPKVALLSAYTKDEALRAFAQNLIELGWEILASSGTKKFLDGHGIPSTDIASIVGPPILGHRVVTLSREVHAGILADLLNREHLAELRALGIKPISLVYVGFYPLEEELAKLQAGTSTPYEVVEKIDIGGPTLVRAAAKAGRIVLASPHLFQEVLEHLRQNPDNPFANVSTFNRFAWLAEHLVHDYTGHTAAFYQSLPQPDPLPAGA